MPSFSGTHLVISTFLMDDRGLMVSDAADITNNAIIHGMDLIMESCLAMEYPLVKINQTKYFRLEKVVMINSSV